LNNQNKKLWLIIGLLGGLIICLTVVIILYFVYVKPGSSDSDRQTASAANQTAAAEATNQAVGTSTQTIKTDTPISPPTSTQASIQTTPTLKTEALLISANLDTNCREGPDTVYPVIGHFQRGQTSEVQGSNISQTWWYIQNPDNTEGYCWVWGETTYVEGITNEVAIITPPPPPPLGMDFIATYSHIEDCDVPVAVFAIENTGTLKLESLQMLIVDITKGDQLYWVPMLNRPFWSSKNSCNLDWNYMDPGDYAYVGGVLSDTGIIGDKAQAVIKLCSEENQGGQCKEETVQFTINY
jgi:uncharacterized protein (UPF0333 family)